MMAKRFIIILFIWIIFLGSMGSLSENSSRLCFVNNGSSNAVCNDVSPELSCPDDYLIRLTKLQVETKIRGQMNNCRACPPSYKPEEWENITDKYIETLLYEACSKKSTCHFKSNNISNVIYVWTVSVKFDCVEKDLFQDICSPWIQKTDSVHISLNKTSNVTRNCSCAIKGDREKTNIGIVDYRPYRNDFRCPCSSVTFAGNDSFQCIENDIERAIDCGVFNQNIIVNNNVTNISMLFSYDLPQMIWLHVTGKNMTVECNEENYISTLPPSLQSSPNSSLSVTSTASRLETFTTLQENRTTQKTTYTELKTLTTSSSILNVEDENKTIFSLPVTAGGSAGIFALIIIIIVITCLLCKSRKQYRTTKDKGKENMNVENFAQSTTNYDVINQGHETESRYFKKSPNLHYEEIEDLEEKFDDGGNENDTEYAKPADVVIDINNAEKGPSMMSENAGTTSMGHNFKEPSDKTLVTGNESRMNYAKAMKSNKKKDAYESWPGIDNYSHIQMTKPKQAAKTEDNYYHIQISGNKPQSPSLSNYSHIKVNQLEESKNKSGIKEDGDYDNLKD